MRLPRSQPIFPKLENNYVLRLINIKEEIQYYVTEFNINKLSLVNYKPKETSLIFVCGQLKLKCTNSLFYKDAQWLKSSTGNQNTAAPPGNSPALPVDAAGLVNFSK